MSKIGHPEVCETIRLLHETARELEEKCLKRNVERNADGLLTYIQYGQPLDENAEPEHLLEIDDAIRRALRKGWNPNDESDPVCRYSVFLWNSIDSHYLHKRADELQKEYLDG